MIKVKIKKLVDSAVVPKYAHEGDAGVDLYSTEELMLQPGQRVLISTGISISIPDSYEAQVRPRSGMSIKYGLSVVNSPGTIDCKYRGEIKVILINHGERDFRVEKGMKIAQMVFNKVEIAEFKEVEELDDTKRGSDGFGSTGQ